MKNKKIPASAHIVKHRLSRQPKDCSICSPSKSHKTPSSDVLLHPLAAEKLKDSITLFVYDYSQSNH
ncbi:hypothetical protein F2Q70_00040071 [Brassica cretica]|uniref:Uncharacterized protein n=1 Tax=Brassica cretica TaxID=69181 RepID=A0A8S9K854_BRACR|nr:hypothetical protein F2Q70_00040071 [Brassica cretica]